MVNVNVNQDKANLYKKIVKVMAKVEHIPKRGRNTFHNYDYVTESDVVDFTRKLLVEEGLVVFNNVREYELNGDIATVTIDFTLCDADTGESVSTCIVGQGQDKGDKAFYKAMAGATKYYLMKTFLIPTGDDPEADTTTDKKAYGNPLQNNNQQWNNHQQPPQQGQRRQTSNPPSGNGNGNAKPITPKQLQLINQRISEIATLVGQEETEVMEQMKQRVGNFNELDKIPSFKASKCIDLLTKWKSEYKNQIQ